MSRVEAQGYSAVHHDFARLPFTHADPLRGDDVRRTEIEDLVDLCYQRSVAATEGDSILEHRIR